jgi:C-3',4' desaturase CrtD
VLPPAVRDPMHIVVIGAGVGGLTAGAMLLKAGYRVTVLEAHIYPGGCAGTFYHQGYRFDAGATLAGGFSPGGPHARLAEILELEWPAAPVDPAWSVHLPDRTVTQWADPRRWRDERQLAFPGQEKFWRLQERLAGLSWDVSTRPFPWPPESAREVWALASALRPRTMGAAPYLLKTVRELGAGAGKLFDTFLDAQLLIAAQTSADRANALYGSAALDLPRRGVSNVRGGIGSLARTLADWITAHGGEVIYRQKVEHIEMREGRARAVHTTKGLRLEADGVLANVTPWAVAALLGQAAPAGLLKEVRERVPTWGAFTLYLGLEDSQLPAGLPDHHQVIVDPSRPLGETNSVFIALSDSVDSSRAPAGKRAATVSTHTLIEPWEQLRRSPAGTEKYEQRKAEYADRMLAAAEHALPGLRQAVRLNLPGTPATFEYYTRRPQGMVGGFPQTSLFGVRGPGLGLPNVWLVGDSIFPGQSTAGVTLGGMRVAETARQALGRPRQYLGLERLKGSA